MVRDIMPGADDSNPDNLTGVAGFIAGSTAGGTLYFTADDGVHGVELWKIIDAPPVSLTNPGDQLSREGDVISLPLTASGDNLAFSATGLPPGLSIDTATGVISGKVSLQAGQANPYQVTVYGDWNNNGARNNSNEPGISGRTVYVDQNGNGQVDSGERSATTDAQGHYEINNLPGGVYNVRQVVPAGWTGTTVGGVSVGSGFVQGVDLGQYKPTSLHNYASTKVPQKTSNGKPNAISTLSITDTAPIYDLTLTLNLSNTKNLPLTIFLIAPDGTKITLLSNTVVNGTLTFQTSAFAFKGVKRTWTLEVDGLIGGTLNRWSLSVLEPITP